MLASNVTSLRFLDFGGVLKQRYSDFIVNEVDTDGNVVHLTCLDAPPPPEKVEKNRETEEKETDTSYTSEIDSFRALASDTEAELLKGLIDQLNSGVGEKISPIVLSPDYDKLHRTAVHNFFKENLKFLVTDMDLTLLQNVFE